MLGLKLQVLDDGGAQEASPAAEGAGEEKKTGDGRGGRGGGEQDDAKAADGEAGKGNTGDSGEEDREGGIEGMEVS